METVIETAVMSSYTTKVTLYIVKFVTGKPSLVTSKPRIVTAKPSLVTSKPRLVTGKPSPRIVTAKPLPVGSNLVETENIRKKEKTKNEKKVRPFNRKNKKKDKSKLRETVRSSSSGFVVVSDPDRRLRLRSYWMRAG